MRLIGILIATVILVSYLDHPGKFSFKQETGLTLKVLADTMERDTVIRVDAKPVLGFNFPYYIFIPRGARLNSNTYLLVETNNAGPSDTFQYHDEQAKLQVQGRSLGNNISRRLKIPFLMPAFPRSRTIWKYYTHALDRDAILIDSGPEKRLDLQLVSMIRDAQSAVCTLNLILNDQVLLNGFSASGTFANRFTMIHPEMVKAVACGGINAMPILPVKAIGRVKLYYPVGVYDFERIFGNRPNWSEYKKIPQLLYMGEEDDNDAVLFDDAYTEEERATVFKAVGKKMIPDRWEKCSSVYASAGVNASFKTYTGIGHGTNGKINAEVADFFRTNINK